MKRISKKIVLITTSAIVALATIIAVLVIKLTNPFKPSFYAFSSYMDAQTKTEISKKYNYREYGSFEEFEYAIGNNKAIAGIASDYSIYTLIEEGKLAPISYDLLSILKEEKIISQDAQLENLWEYFSEVTNKQMNFYDYLLQENLNLQNMLNEKYSHLYGEDYVYKFRDFIVPYFINDRVVAYDTSKILGTTYEIGTELDPLGIKNDNSDLSIILSTLQSKAQNKLKIQWTKNPVENVVYGSSYDNAGIYIEDISTKITFDNYLKWINNFDAMVKVSTSGSISNDSKNIFDSDSDLILNNLINPTSKISAAILYNGDALDAYYGHDNFQAVEDGDRLRILRSSNNIRILDGFVVSSSINDEQRREILYYFNKWVFNNMFTTKEKLEDQAAQDLDIYEEPGIIRIFDYVNYTPAAKGVYEFIKENYFILENEGSKPQYDCVAIDIYSIELETPGEPIYPISKQLLSDLTLEFQRKLNGK